MPAEVVEDFGLWMLAKTLGRRNFKKLLVKTEKDMDKIVSINLANNNYGKGSDDDF